MLQTCRRAIAVLLAATAGTAALTLTGASDANAATGYGIATLAYQEYQNNAPCGTFSQLCDPNPEWCADFARWVWAHEGVDTTGLNTFAYSFLTYADKHGMWEEKPRPGDAIVYGDGNGTANHVNIVYAVNDAGTEVETVGGNEGDRVSFTSWWKLSDAASVMQAGPIMGIVHPLGVS